jgi:HSP20 family protein
MEGLFMAETVTKIPVKIREKAADVPSTTQAWTPFLSLRREMDRLFDDFGRGFWPTRRSAFDVEPFWQQETTWAAPAVDIAESQKAYEITAELPGMDEKNIEVKVANGNLIIKGERQEEKEAAPSSAASTYQKVSTGIRSKQASVRACSP